MRKTIPYGGVKLKERGWILIGRCGEGHSVVLDTSYSDISSELESYIQCECDIDSELCGEDDIGRWMLRNSAKNGNLKLRNGGEKK